MIPALLLTTFFRVVPLACDGDRLAISGGGILRLAIDATCDRLVPGRAAAISLDDNSRAVPAALDAHARPAAEIPRAAFVLAPSAPIESEATQVTVTIEVTIPARTPAGSDIYLSTDRSGYNPSEIRMDQVDARRYRLQLRLRDGARLAFRVTRGSFATLERDSAGRLPPTHHLVASPNATLTVAIPGWSDDT